MTIKAGEFIICRKPKMSTRPSPRAKEVYPARHGDTYSYIVEKFWKVVRIIDENTIEIETRRGKRRKVNTDLHQLRKPGLLERFVFRNRFF